MSNKNQQYLNRFGLKPWYYYQGTTAVCLLLQGELRQLVARGISICSIRDNFNERLGRNIALGRALLAYFNGQNSMPIVPSRFVNRDYSKYVTLWKTYPCKSAYMPASTDLERKMLGAITHFRDAHKFLSNFFVLPSSILWLGHACPTVEHAYQLSKTRDKGWQKLIATTIMPGQAKRIGNKRNLPLREDWEDIKVDTMTELLRLKFSSGILHHALLGTGDVELVEGNWWHDNFWGSCECQSCGNRGKNWLGKLLMKVREELRETS